VKTTLLDEISNRDNLVKAWKSLSKRAFSFGLDKVTIEEFGKSLDGQLDEIQKQLNDPKDTYKFAELRLYLADKKDGGYRPIKIPAVRDRVVQKAIYDVIYPYLDKKYKIDNPASYAYIKSRKIEDVATKILKLRSEGYRYCCKADIVKFFENVNKKKLLKLVTDALPDASINKLIEAVIVNDISNVDLLYYETKTGKAYKYDEVAGIAQGSPLSPMFANLYLADFDAYMLNKGYEIMRYADDILVLAKNKSEATNAFHDARANLKKVKLSIHPLRDEVVGKLWSKDAKYSYVGSIQHLEFLGLRFVSDKVYPANSSYKNVMKAIHQVVDNRSLTLVKKIQSIGARVEGWSSAFAYTTEETDRLQDNDKKLNETLERMLEKHNLQRKNKSKSTTKTLGLPTFQSALSTAKARRKSKDSKSK
jgi:group II intron reverse transcriptase/maturase